MSGHTAELLIPQGRTHTYYHSQEVRALEAGLHIIPRRPVVQFCNGETRHCQSVLLMLLVCTAVHSSSPLSYCVRFILYCYFSPVFCYIASYLDRDISNVCFVFLC